MNEPPCFYQLRDLLQRPELLHPPPVVVPRLAWEGRVTLLAAPEKSGKSTLLGQAVAAVAEGREFLGDPTDRGVTLWLALDEPLPDLVRRLAEYGATDRVIIAPSRPSSEELVNMIQAERARLLVIDTATEFAAGDVEDLNSAAQWRPLLRALRGAMQQTGGACVLLHHMGRTTGKYRDSSQLGAGVDTILEMSISPDEATVRKVRARGRMQMEDFTLRFFLERRHYELDQGELALDVRVYRVIEAQPGIGLARIRKAVSGGSSAVDAMVRDLEFRGAIVDRGDRGGHSYYTKKLEHVIRAGQGSGKVAGNPATTALTPLRQGESSNGQGSGQAHLAGPLIGGLGGKVPAETDSEGLKSVGSGPGLSTDWEPPEEPPW